MLNRIYFNIQIMSKKPQPQAKENPKNRPQIVDQQNEPFLKTLQKKVRNINKKLTEIAELEAKDNLKPEQVEKVNRKAALIEERARVEETATLFKETYAENAAVYRNIQLKELEVLARAIALFHTGAKLPESDKLANLWHALEQTDNFSTINDAIASLSESLKNFANDRKLQKALTAYVEENGNNKIVPIVSNQEKIVNDILEEKVEVKPEPVVVAQTPAPVVAEPEPAPVLTPVATVAASEPEPVKVETPVVAEKVEEAPVVAVEAQTTPLTEAAQTQPAKTEEKPAAEQREYKKRNYGNRENRENNNRRGEYRNNNRREGEERGEKRQYRPKYAEKAPAPQQQRQEESESSDSEPEVRNFRKEEIRQLEEDGFIVISKPKPKAKDQREQRQFHEHQHGKKPYYNNAQK